MKLGIMQPYFFPYIGYWQLMNAVDRYVIYDDVNFIKGGWINRNQILLNGDAVRINLILSQASSFKKINETQISPDKKPLKNLIRTIEGAYHNAPQFSQAFPIIQSILENEDKNLASFLCYANKEIHDYLNMSCELIISSEIDKDNELKGKDKVIDICRLLGADTYYNAVGGMELYDKDEFKHHGIDLRFLETDSITYPQFKNNFIPNLSIIDVMMFNDKEEITKMLNQYQLL